MKTFGTLVQALDSTNKTSRKLDAIEQFLQEATEEDKLWLLALFTGKRPKRTVSTTLLKQWAIEQTGLPEWLFLESYAAVGDLGETISLVLPPPQKHSDNSLTEWMEQLMLLKEATDAEKKVFVLDAWNSLPFTERFIFNKLLGGSFRLGISSRSLIQALAKHFNLEENAVTHSIMGHWKTGEVRFNELVRGAYTDIQLSRPYPFCLAYPLETEPEKLGNCNDWQAEYKWDGIRVQLIKRQEEVFIWSRGEELITGQFPEIEQLLQQCRDSCVIDGELLVVKNGMVLNFSELQKRLNRKNIAPRLLKELPATVFMYDLMEWNRQDYRNHPLSERRKLLEMLTVQQLPGFSLSPIIEYNNWEELKTIRIEARSINSEGLMLKNRNGPYHTGRKKGDWWKWKIDPFTIDAVLIYAQKGSGRRSGYYTDYTFAVKQGEQLVSIAKAYSGLTDKEIQEVSRFITKNAIEKFGPVRTVKPELVFEIAFEGISFSVRHKSGVALRFPRIVRWRKDKTVADIDDISQIKKLIH